MGIIKQTDLALGEIFETYLSRPAKLKAEILKIEAIRATPEEVDRLLARSSTAREFFRRYLTENWWRDFDD